MHPLTFAQKNQPIFNNPATFQTNVLDLSTLKESRMQDEFAAMLGPFMHAVIAASHVLGQYMGRVQALGSSPCDDAEAQAIKFLMDAHQKSPLLLPEYLNEYIGGLLEALNKSQGEEIASLQDQIKADIADLETTAEATAEAELEILPIEPSFPRPKLSVTMVPLCAMCESEMKIQIEGNQEILRCANPDCDGVGCP